MSLRSKIAHRGIAEVVHFTTNHGLAGILACGALKARQRLTGDKYLEHIYKHNCNDRSRDSAWHDYVNLSITKINTSLFGISSGNWHRDIDGWWCVLAFDPVILTHEGVIFTTTNNMYTGVRRQGGDDGFDAMFADNIVRWNGNVIRRPKEWPDNRPTCPYAEALYPGEVNLSHLRAIYVREAAHIADIAGMCGALSLPLQNCIIKDEAFRA